MAIASAVRGLRSDTIEGQATPYADLEFRNAFDPDDMTIYRPSDTLPGPVMATVWGDRTDSAHGTVAIFPPGFVAPLHTHSSEYNGALIQGQLTNPFGTDLERFLDEDTENNHGDVVLEAGSHWQVSGGAQHTTTCIGPEPCVFYFHQESGFDFVPFVTETGELQEGVELEAPATNVFHTRADLEFSELAPFVSFAPAWGEMNGPDAYGMFGLFPAAAVSPTHVHGAAYYGVVIEGELSNPFNLATSSPTLDNGSFWSVPGKAVHLTSCADTGDCLFYIHQRSGFDFTPLCEQ